MINYVPEYIEKKLSSLKRKLQYMEGSHDFSEYYEIYIRQYNELMWAYKCKR